MTALRAKIRNFSRERLMLILSVYMICQPLLDIITAWGIKAHHPITAGVVARSLFMALGVLYVVFISEFPGKRLPLIYLGVLVGYLALFMLHILLLGGVSLCLQNLTEVVKTFFAPFVLIFLYCVYREYGVCVTTQSVGAAGAIYCSVILVAWLTGTSNKSYDRSGYGFNGWFYAANEIGCIIALTAPFTIYHCVKMVPNITKKTWWKVPVIVWCLAAAAFSANYIGTKIVFLFTLVYALAGLVWTLFQLGKARSVTALCQTAVMLALLLMVTIPYQHSALKSYLDRVYQAIIDVPSDELITWWAPTAPPQTAPPQTDPPQTDPPQTEPPQTDTPPTGEDPPTAKPPEDPKPMEVLNELQQANVGAWLADLLTRSPLAQRLDQVLSRRLYTSSPCIQVFLDGGIGVKLLGVGYADTDAFERPVHYMIEMDPPAILVRHGILGFAAYCVPYFAFVIYAVIQFFKHPILQLSSLRCCTLLYCTLAGCAIATIAGHALVSPAVSTFVLTAGMGLWVHIQEQNPLPKTQEAS